MTPPISPPPGGQPPHDVSASDGAGEMRLLLHELRAAVGLALAVGRPGRAKALHDELVKLETALWSSGLVDPDAAA